MSILQDIATALPSWQQAATGGLAIIGGGLTLYGGFHATKDIAGAISARRSGLHTVFKNAQDNIDFANSLKAVERAFEEKPRVRHIFIEMADHAIIAQRGKEPIVLDFTKRKEEMTDAVLYTQIKSMIGVESPKKIYEFVQGGWDQANSIVQGKAPHGMSADDADRIREHARMKCSDIRNMIFKPRGRRLALENHSALLSVVGGYSRFNQPQKTNISRRGSLAFAWNANPDQDNEKFAPDTIIVKPRTRSEREFWSNLTGTLRANVDKAGKPLSGEEVSKIYAQVRKEQDKHDLDELKRPAWQRLSLVRSFV